MNEPFPAEPPPLQPTMPMASNGHAHPGEHHPRLVQFGAFELDLDTGELRKHGLKVKLQGKPFQILNALLERPGEVVTRDQLRGRLWPADTFVDFESGLNTAANRLRITLGDSADHPHYVETLARAGYRFIAPVTVISPPIQVVSVVTPEAAPAIEQPAPLAPPPVLPPARRRWHWPLAAILLCGALAAGAWGWLRPTAPLASFQQVTFRKGTVGFARFTLDGQSVVYSGRFGDDHRRLYLADVNSPESRALDIQDAALAGVSRTGELAVLLFNPDAPTFGSRLARVPLNGGSPMPIADGVGLADWLPDGSTLAILRVGPRGASVEFPLGKEIYRTSSWIDGLRVSPAGDAVGFIEHPVMGDDAGAIKVLDASGKVTLEVNGWASASGLAWSPSGREVLFTAARAGALRELWAAKRSGSLRNWRASPCRCES